MIFFVGNDGTVISSVPEPVYQGSVNANTIYLIAPFAANLQVTVAFKLPNGVWTERYLMTQTNEITEVINKQTGKTYSGWQFSMPNEITQYYGTVTAQFFFYSGQGVITASSSTSFTVGRGVPEILPDTPSEDIYNEILDNLSILTQQVNNGTFAARSVFAWRQNEVYNVDELVYYPDKGEYGVFVKSLTDNNKAEPYTDGKLNSVYWQEITDFNVLNGLYGLETEMENAVEASRSNAESAKKSAAASALSSQNAEESAMAAQSAAQSVEGLRKDITEILDGTRAVVKAISDENGNNIAHTFAAVNSDIEGLREDITNESHFRGMFDSVQALRAAYPTATPNDYAYIVGGNQWIYQNGAWTDSGQPSPNTAVPASNSTPLMDGNGNAGVSSQYSRGDHRHPSDTNKVSKSGDTMTGPLNAPSLKVNGSEVYSPGNLQPPYQSNADIPNNGNLNDYVTPGVYTSQNSDFYIYNKPYGSSSAGKLTVYTTTSSLSYVNQEWQEVASTNRWIRSSNADSGSRNWSSWQYVGGNPPIVRLSQIAFVSTDSGGYIDANYGPVYDAVDQATSLFVFIGDGEVPHLGIGSNFGENESDWRIVTDAKSQRGYLYQIVAKER